MGVARRKAVRATSSVPLVRSAIRTPVNVKRRRVPTAPHVIQTTTPIVRPHPRTIFVLASRVKRAKSWETFALSLAGRTRRIPVPRVMPVKKWTWMGLSGLSVCAIVPFLPSGFEKTSQIVKILKSRHSCHTVPRFAHRLHSRPWEPHVVLLTRSRYFEKRMNGDNSIENKWVWTFFDLFS